MAPLDAFLNDQYSTVHVAQEIFGVRSTTAPLSVHSHRQKDQLLPSWQFPDV